VGAALSAPVAGLAFAADGTLWASGGTVFKSPGFVWRITPAGVAEEWLQIPDAVFLNGCACLPDENRLLICESISGRILAIGRSEQTWSAWITDDQLRPVNDTMPGANGIKYRAGYVYVSITDRNRIERIPIDNDNSAGPIEVVADHVRADDFAFSRSGAL
jgi:sugar lactone lactonase YvrE